MNVEDEIATLKLRVAQLEKAKASLTARIELLDSAVSVSRAGREQLLEENRRLRRALQTAETNLAALPLLLQSLERSPSEEMFTEAQGVVSLVLDLFEAALRDPLV